MPSPYYSHAGIQIFHGDCREILPQLGRFDLLLTDPPYGTGWVRGGGAVGEFAPMFSRPEWDVFGTEFIGLSDAAGIAVFAPVNRSTELMCAVDAPSATLYYRKTNPQPLGPTREAIVCSPIPWKSQLWEFAAYNGDSPLHPCQKPLALMKWCVSLFPDAKTLLDPFCGSGTSLVAAKEMGLTAVGIEREEKYCEIAAKRLSQEVLQYA